MPFFAKMMFAVSLSAAMASPPLPFLDWGACPFECCTYGEWTARSSITAYVSRDTKARRAFTIRKGEKVRAITGVVITTKPGRIRILEPITFGDKNRFRLKRGDVVYTLHYIGEGYELFWYRGVTDSSELLMEPFVGNGPAKMEVLDETVSTWWIKVRNASGRIGWVNESDFNGTDACG